MPLKRSNRQREPHTSREQEEREEEQQEVRAKQPKMEPFEDKPAAPGRPYSDYVEREAEKFRQEAVKTGSRDEPGPELDQAGERALKAVNAMHLHFWEKGWIKPPYSRLEMYPDFVEALIQLAEDTGWLAREILLPVHPEPKHPPVYYTIDPVTKRSVPREDALIRGDYVHTRAGNPITRAEYINPWPHRRRRLIQDIRTLISLGWDASYTFYMDRNGQSHILFLWTEPVKVIFGVRVLNRCFLEDMIFSPPSSAPVARRGAGAKP